MLESATVGLAFGAYIALFFNLDVRLFAVVAVLILTMINVAGIRSSTNVSIVMSIIKVGVLVIFAFVGLSAVQPTNFEPFAPEGFGGVLAASAIIFFAYTGYARIATGEEIKAPQKTIPRAIVLALAITAIIYVAVTTVGIGLVGVNRFGNSVSPIATAASALGNPVLVAAVVFGASVATLSVLLSDLLTSSRTVLLWRETATFPVF